MLDKVVINTNKKSTYIVVWLKNANNDIKATRWPKLKQHNYPFMKIKNMRFFFDNQNFWLR